MILPHSPFLKMKTTDLLFLVGRINAAAATGFLLAKSITIQRQFWTWHCWTWQIAINTPLSQTAFSSRRKKPLSSPVIDCSIARSAYKLATIPRKHMHSKLDTTWKHIQFVLLHTNQSPANWSKSSRSFRTTHRDPLIHSNLELPQIWLQHSSPWLLKSPNTLTVWPRVFQKTQKSSPWSKKLKYAITSLLLRLIN